MVLAKQLHTYQPNIYAANVPSRFAQLYPELALVLANKPPASPFSRMLTLQSKNGQDIISFAKHRKWGKGNTRLKTLSALKLITHGLRVTSSSPWVIAEAANG